MTEVWIVLLLYGGRVMDYLPLLERRGVGRTFGWIRRAGPHDVRALAGGAPRKLTLMMDSTVVVRYGLKQAGAGAAATPRRSGAVPAIIRSWRSSWRRATAWACAGEGAARTPPKGRRLRNWLLRLPAKQTTHARKDYLQFLRGEPVRSRLLNALRGLNRAIPPPVPA